jgi:threonine dehydrogenase-like Zn-dependent dehydrogenase
MLQSQWTETGIALHDVDPGPLAPEHVRLHVAACGICGSDLHRYRETGLFVFKDLRMAGSKVYGQSQHGPEFGVATALLPRHRDTIRVLQTHQYPLSAIGDAFAAASDKTLRPIKVTVLADH